MRTKSITILITAFLLSPGRMYAQFFFKANTAVQQVLQQVIADFPNQLQTITGNLIQENTESINYTSKIILPGTESCIVTKYKSEKNKNRSWQAVLPETEAFVEAKKQYRELFMQVKNLNISTTGNTNANKLKGVYDAPVEEKKFAGSIFSITGNAAYENVKVEVALQYNITGWQVSLYVYDKMEDDKIAPDR